MAAAPAAGSGAGSGAVGTVIDVAIVGGGPTGLLLAAELALAGLRCVVLERRKAPRDDSRAICLHARSLEVLDLRGQAETFVRQGLAVSSFPLGPRGAKIDFAALDSDFPYMLDMPQSRIERILLERALALGAQVHWSSTVTAVGPDDGGVTLTLDTGDQLRAAYVVGCDGVRSFVREAAGVPFPGIHNPGSVILADLQLSGLPMDSAFGDLSASGMMLMFPFRDGTCRLVLYDWARADVPVSEPVDLAEVTASLRRVAGRDLGPHDLTWSRRYRSESRQVPSYRAGRIFLAGDAAHAHSPAGAQGMNTGLQDAVNLGWKLAAAVGGRAPGWLLDTYQAERHPVGAQVLALTGRQFRLNTVRSAAGRARRWAVHRLAVPLPPVQSRLARDYSGLSISYPGEPGAAAHALAGTRLPRGRVSVAGQGSVRLYDLFRDGGFVLLNRDDTGQGAVRADGVPVVSYRSPAPAGLPAAVLVRPDGYIAWASDEGDSAARARAAETAIRTWRT